MTAALLGHMDVAGQDGLVAKDLIHWYMTSDNYNPPIGHEGKEDAGGNGGEAAVAAAADTKSQLLTVIRRMIKRDKSIVAVKSTVKGSKRIEDMLLKLPARPDAADYTVGATVAAVHSGDESDVDQVAKLRKQIEEKKAALLAKANATARETEGNDMPIARAADDAADNPSIVRK